MKQIRELNQKINEANSQKEVGYQLFLYYANDNSASFCFAVRQSELAQNAISDALKELGLVSSSAYSNEISPYEFTEKLRECLGVKYIHDDRLIQLLGGKAYLSRMHEAPIKETASKTELIQRANDLLYGQTLVPEIERIYAGGKVDSSSGHPVHYIVKSDDIETCDAVTDVLLSALAENNRLKNKNSCRITIDGKFWTHDDHIKTLRSVSGGSAVILCHKERYERDNSDETIKQMCDMLSKYNRDILFVFQLPANSKTADKLISRNTCGITFVSITEETLTESEDMPFAEEVHNYLRGLAESTNVEPT